MGWLFSKILTKEEQIEEEEQNKNKLNRDKKEHEKYCNIDELFERFDVNGNGTMDAKEFKTAVVSFMEVNQDKNLNDLLELIDTEDKGSLDKYEFRTIMMSFLKDEEDIEEWLDLFKIFDKNYSGEIGESELVHVLKNLGMKLTEAEALDLIMEVNASDQSKKSINFEDFLRIMMSN